MKDKRHGHLWREGTFDFHMAPMRIERPDGASYERLVLMKRERAENGKVVAVVRSEAGLHDATLRLGPDEWLFRDGWEPVYEWEWGPG